MKKTCPPGTCRNVESCYCAKQQQKKTPSRWWWLLGIPAPFPAIASIAGWVDLPWWVGAFPLVVLIGALILAVLHSALENTPDVDLGDVAEE